MAERQGRNVMVSTFRVPDEYERARLEAERRAALAQMLEAQAYQPLDVRQPAPIAPSQGLAKILKSYMGAYERKKAEEAEEKAKGEEIETAEQIMGRLTGREIPEFEPDEAKRAEQEAARAKEIADMRAETEASIARQRETGQLEEITLPASLRYIRDPEEALRLADTPAGQAAMASRPLMAARLAQLLEKPEKAKSPYGPIDVSKFTPESVQKFNVSLESGKPDYTLLQSREYSDLTAQQRSNLAVDLARLGIDVGRFGYETGMQVPMPSFAVGAQTFGPGAPQTTAAPQMPGAAPTTVAPAAAPTTANFSRLPPKARQELESQLMKENLESTKAQLASASKAQEGLVKTYKALDLLEQGKPITGAGADIRLMGERLQSLFTGQPSSQVTDSQLLDALLGSEVFSYIQSLGVGSRGLDTPAERDFLLNVMTGTRQLDNETLREMTKLRAKVLENNLDAINERINSGDLDWYFELQAPYGVRKRPFERPARQVPAGTNPIRSQADAILRGEQ
jgi:hypothetical protein